MSEPVLTTRVDEARAALDRHLVGRARVALQSGDRFAVLARLGGEGGVGSAARDPLVRRSRQVRAFRGRVAARRTGATLGPEGPRRSAGLRLRDRRDDGHSEDPDQHRRLPHRLRAVLAHAARRALPPRRQLADARAERSAPAAAGGRTSRALSRRHLLLRRSRSALGHQADQEGLDRAPEGVSGARDRPGRHDPVGRARHQVHVHHARSCSKRWRSGWKKRGRRSARPASRESFRAARNSRRSGIASPTRSCSTART